MLHLDCASQQGFPLGHTCVCVLHCLLLATVTARLCLGSPFVCLFLFLTQALINEDSHVPVLKSNWDTYLAYPSCLLKKHDDYFLPRTHISAEYLYKSKICLTRRETEV